MLQTPKLLCDGLILSRRASAVLEKFDKIFDEETDGDDVPHRAEGDRHLHSPGAALPQLSTRIRELGNVYGL